MCTITKITLVKDDQFLQYWDDTDVLRPGDFHDAWLFDDTPVNRGKLDNILRLYGNFEESIDNTFEDFEIHEVTITTKPIEE